MREVFIYIWVVIFNLICFEIFGQNRDIPVFIDPRYGIRQRIEDNLRQMMLDEKADFCLAWISGDTGGKLRSWDYCLFSSQQNQWIIEPRKFEIQIGCSSRDIRISGILKKDIL